MNRVGLSLVLVSVVRSLDASSYAQQSAQWLDAPVLIGQSTSERMNALLDLDGDGFDDAVGAFRYSTGNFGIYTYRNDGAGRLTIHSAFSISQTGTNLDALPVASADLDGDGLDDFAVGSRSSVRVYRSNGVVFPTLAKTLTLPADEHVKDLEIADFDGNGTLDLALVILDTANGELGIRRVFAPLGTASFSLLVPTPFAAGTDARVIDSDGDGDADLVITGNQYVDFFVLDGGEFEHSSRTPHGLVAQPMGAPGDIDGDGDVDVVVFGMEGQYTILRRTGPATFVKEAKQVGGPATDLADVDGDGDLDGVCCGGSGGTPYYNDVLSKFEIAKNDGAGEFAESFELPGFGSNRIAGVTDLDHDGDADLVAGRVVWYSDDGIEPIRFGEHENDFHVFQVYDLEDDGDPDMMVTGQTQLRNSGDGALAPHSRTLPVAPLGTVYFDTARLADYDGDGDTDVLVANFGANTPLHDRLLVDSGGGNLLDAGPITAAANPLPTDVNRAIPADLNGDGALDLVCARVDILVASPEGVSCFVSADGILQPTFSDTTTHPKFVADLDSDGFDDFVGMGPTSSFVRWGDASGAMTATTTITATGAPQAFRNCAAGDFDLDGDLDVLVPLALPPTQDRTVLLVRNDGPRSFAKIADRFHEYAGLVRPLLVADLDLDGREDVLVGNRKPTGVVLPATSIFRGKNQDGAFFEFLGDQWPLLEQVVDLDGDGDLDAFADADGDFLGHGDKYSLFSPLRDGPSAGLRRQYGAPTAGFGGVRPTFGASGPFLAGSAAELRIRGAAPNAPGLILVGLDDQSGKLGATGGFLVTLPIIVALNVVFPGTPGVAGSGALTIPYVAPPAAAGLSFFHQIVAIDPSAQGGASVSNGLELFYGG